jgi:NAD(P)-dependent dehydrogenase (short-subunit alcohol dehydrogenase family)
MGYSVTKAAALHLMKHLALSVGPKIRVNAVLPGLLLTDWVSPPVAGQTFYGINRFLG